ncbi:retrotransposon protein, putative, ty1-copia subclass [Tanacetum coccineum]
MDGNVHTYKARLVANGYTQTHEIDYEETSSPVAKIKSIRIMLAIAVFHDYEILQMDIKTAFINGKLIEDAYRSWSLCFHEKVTQFRFSRSEDQSCIYVKVSGSVVVFLVLYVDDILLIGNDIPTLQSVKDWLGKCFAMKDLEDATYILDKRKEAMSSKDVKEEKTESDSDDDTINLTGSVAESSKKKKMKRFVFITEQGDHVHLTKEQIKEQKRIAESVKADVAKQEVEVRKEEWIDFLGVDVVKKILQSKVTVLLGKRKVSVTSIISFDSSYSNIWNLN